MRAAIVRLSALRSLLCDSIVSSESDLRKQSCENDVLFQALRHDTETSPIEVVNVVAVVEERGLETIAMTLS